MSPVGEENKILTICHFLSATFPSGTLKPGKHKTGAHFSRAISTHMWERIVEASYIQFLAPACGGPHRYLVRLSVKRGTGKENPFSRKS